MNSQIGFIVKVLILAIALSVAIKYGGQALAIAPTPTNVLLGILLLPALVAVALGWRARNAVKLKESSPERLSQKSL
ncbi:hypothetical protein Ple7327_0715 [Pleurocapsa sp. PCC 7327]|uniref:hypothetical protein n=1 Tax=Pleurocapsa sp. PCC 7327 TaxID=118163 RepID=UPI00029F920E|nr:hypothetical protein [Pleurocapsa sp. PCC 7327]AFY76145.1 hypothetical protein Ple7327_0715 [Pleurocapsa sp. PCC 7327]